MRIISLLPSATQTLYEIGAADLLVGRSHDSPPPVGRADVPVLTGQAIPAARNGKQIDQMVRDLLASGSTLHTLDGELLRSLKPDVILTQDLCRVCSIDLESVRQVIAPLKPTPLVLNFEPHTLEQVLDDMLRLGDAIERLPQAQQALTRRREQFFTAREHVNPFNPGPRAVVLEWINPLFVAGHWTPDLVDRAGAQHLLTKTPEPSREIEPDELVDASPEVIFVALCGEPTSFAKSELKSIAHEPWWRELPAVTSQRVYLMDGSETFSRPSPTLIDTYCLLVSLINDIPELAPKPRPVTHWQSEA